ncbi:hypothetical protein FQN54_001322 [Arachnomyces sp. PD_36]|nr:hypothetical protein FQN54_001322 [Arachnomyces sp. PD_36]
MTSSASQTPPNGPAHQSQEFDPSAFDTSLFGLSPVQPPQRSSSRKSNYLPRSGRQITRNRASYSCHTCRRRKVKCDKVHPICGNCLKTGSGCVYDSAPKGTDDGLDDRGHATKRRRDSSKAPEGESNRSITPLNSRQDPRHNDSHAALQDSKSGPQAIEARLDRLTSMVERLSRANGPQTFEDDDNHTLRRDTWQDAETRELKLGLSRLEGSIRGASESTPHCRSRQQSPKDVDAGNDDFPIPAGLSTDVVDPVGTLNLGHLSLEDGGRSRYVGSTFWAYISDEINELNQVLRDQNRCYAFSAVTDESSPDVPFGDEYAPSFGKASVRGLSRRGSTQRGPTRHDTFHRTVLFPSGDSPAYNDVIELDMLNHVPTKRQSDILYKGFMSGIHAITPVLHPPSILKMYYSFWSWYSSGGKSGEPCPESAFIPLLYAIWYGGSVSISIRSIRSDFKLNSRDELSDPFHDEITRWLTRISFPRSPSMRGLAAFLIVQTILSKEEEPLTSSLFISLALRVAQTMGLHRDPAQFGISPCDAETRRRVWWHIVHMDGVVAMSSGLPPLVSEEDYWDVRECSEVKDTLLGTKKAENYERRVEAGDIPPDNPDIPTICSGPSRVNVYYLSAKGKYIMARSIRHILKIQLGTRQVTRKDMEDLRAILVELQSKLYDIVDRIPPGEPSTPVMFPSLSDPGECENLTLSLSPQSDIPEEPKTPPLKLPAGGPGGCYEQYHSNRILIAFHKWSRILLLLFIHKAFCVAYQPFLKNAKSKIWPSARQGALRHCHGFMEKFILLATDPDFQPFQWSWPGNHQPMHATMIMLIDLYERPNSPEASKSRALIDKIFSLSGPDGGVVGGEDGITTQRPLRDGGREAWDMIRRLREKAWQKAGLDPDVLWTEQDQFPAGVSEASSTGTTSSKKHGTRRASEDLTEAPRPSFADRYYSLIKETHDENEPKPDVDSLNLNQGRAPREPRPQFFDPPMPQNRANQNQGHRTPATATPRTQSQRRQQHLNQLQQQQQQQRHQDPNRQMWSQPVPPPIPQQQPFMMHPQHPSFNTPHIDPTTLTADNHTGLPTGMNPVPDPNAAMGPSPSSATGQGLLDPSSMIDFDWDQWDAVFGQPLPVVDENMDLDTGGPQSMFRNGGGGGGGSMGNWADFG